MKKMTVALMFEDQSLKKMLECEASHLGFELTEPNEADIVLSDSETSTEKYKEKSVVFTDVKKSGDHLHYMPKIFALSELERLCELWQNSKKSHSDGKKTPDKTDELPLIIPDGVMINGKKIKLSAGELTTLCTLAEANGCVSRIDLASALGHSSANDIGNLTDVYICRLREKLEGELGYRLITTVRGVGYKIERKFKYEKRV